jgi:alpha-D-xyloside xylohydrolase
MMRSHGADAPREIYQFGKAGDRNFDAIEKFIKLRYQLLPYIYSTSWDVTANHSSMMRALVMDFANDKNALDINDEFMFGKSILVSPVTTAMYVKPTGTGRDQVMQEDFSSIKTKEVYLPAGTDWYDFWTGEKITGGKKIMRETPLDLLPLFIKAGSILPLGPTVQYATEKKWDNLVINVYPGANGKLVLYEDENDNYNYEKGVYSTINFIWDDKKKTLTIDDRNGSFSGMLQSRTFQIMMPDNNKAVGEKTESVAAKLISYSGKKVVAKF